MQKKLTPAILFAMAVFTMLNSGCNLTKTGTPTISTENISINSSVAEPLSEAETSKKETNAETNAVQETETTETSQKKTFSIHSTEQNATSERSATSYETVAAAKKCPFSQENSTADFRACSITTSELDTFRYWLYIPSEPTEDMPLIVYLHGGSEKGDDLNLITDVDGFPAYLKSGELGDVRGYVIIPQLPASKKGWTDISDSLCTLIQKTAEDFSIDTDNISLTGHSMGGTGTWNLAALYPSLFARIAPLSGSIRVTDENVNALKDLSVWAFAGSLDTIVPPESSEEMVNKLKNIGGKARITILDGADHFSVPSLTYLDTDIHLVCWLLGK